MDMYLNIASKQGKAPSKSSWVMGLCLVTCGCLVTSHYLVTSCCLVTCCCLDTSRSLVADIVYFQAFVCFQWVVQLQAVVCFQVIIMWFQAILWLQAFQSGHRLVKWTDWKAMCTTDTTLKSRDHLKPYITFPHAHGPWSRSKNFSYPSDTKAANSCSVNIVQRPNDCRQSVLIY